MKSLFSILLSLLFLLTPNQVLAADVDWEIQAFASLISIQKDGSVEVGEVIDVNFHSLQKHGIYRDLPVIYTNPDGSKYYTELNVIFVKRDGIDEQYQEIRNGDFTRIKIGDPDKTISGPHTYQITYSVVGVLQSFEDFDEFSWNVTGNNWEVPIKIASASVGLPSEGILQAGCFEGVSGSTKECSQKNIYDNQATFLSTDLNIGEGLTIVVGYQKGIIPIVTIPRPVSLMEQLLSPVGIFIFALSSLLSIGLSLWLWWKWGRDFWWKSTPLLSSRKAQKEEEKPLGAHQQIVVEYEPPEGLRPAEIGVLIDEKADTLDVTSTIIDLAVRGYIIITEEPKKWIFGSVDYILTKTKKSQDSLLSYENELLSRLFDSGDIVSVSGLKTTFYQDLAKVKEKLYEQVALKNLFPDNPDRVRTKYLILGIVVCIVGIFFLIQGISNNIFYLISLGAGVLLGGGTILIISRSMSRRSAHGNELYRRTKGYHLFISKVETYKQQFFERKNMFNEALPYAIVFGLTEKYAQAMKDMGVKPEVTGWYHGTSTFNPVIFSSHINSFSNSLSSAIASAPKSSGFSGGGSSGGGFGGGGGGSW